MPLLLDQTRVDPEHHPEDLGAQGLTIQVVNPLTIPDWDRRVATHVDSTFFHGATWARVLHETYGFAPVYFAAFEADRMRALLPCMEVDTFPGGRRGVCLPFTDHIVPLVESPIQTPLLFDAMTAHGRNRGWRAWQSRGATDQVPGVAGSAGYYQHTLDLRPGPATLFCEFDPSVRRALRKAERSTVEVHTENSAAALGDFYHLHCRTRRKHGLPPQPRTFFDSLQEHILARGRGRLLLAYHQRRAVAGAVFFHWGRSALYKFGASDEDFLDLRANNHVLWHAIECYAFDGFEQIDLGRTSLSNAGLRRYKLGWGAQETPIAYLKYDLRKDKFVPERDLTDGWYNPVFRAMPLPLLRFIGRQLYRHLA